jgi:recombination protein RecT
MSNALEVITDDIWSVQQDFGRVCVDKSIRFEAEAGFAIQTLQTNDYALSVAMQNRQSVINAVQNIAAIGISLNPAKKQAYLVPRDKRICLDISYMGLMDLAMQSGSIRWAQCALVYSGDGFQLNGMDKQPMHTFNPFAKDRGELIGVYAVVKTCDGDYLTHAMSISAVHDIRDRSSAWKAWIEKKRKCPWVTDEGEMTRKTCIKQAHKYWPRGQNSDRLEKAIHYLNEQAGEGLHREAEQQNIRVLPTDGAMEAMSKETQQYLRELAQESEALFKDAGAGAALDRIKADELDNDQTVALWTLLPSDMRSALKAENAARREAAAVLASDTPAAA